MVDVSIVIPVYNVEKYIGKTLDSILAQNNNCFKYEIIIVDDGTPDNSMDIVCSYHDRLSNLKIIHQDNKGLSEARNAGLLASSGQYIWFIDSDDSITDDAFQIVAESLNTHSQIYCFDIIRIDENTRERQLESMIPQKRYRSLYNCINSGRYLYHKIQFGMVQRFIFQRSFLLDNKLFFYKGIYFEDLDFLLRAQFFAQSIMPINKIVYNYLVRGNGSIMSCFKQKHLKDKIQLVHNLYCYRDNYALSLKDKSMFDDAAFNQMYWILNKYKSIEEGELILKTYMPQLKTDGLRCGLYSSSYYLTLGKIYKLIIFILARIK